MLPVCLSSANTGGSSTEYVQNQISGEVGCSTVPTVEDSSARLCQCEVASSWNLARSDIGRSKDDVTHGDDGECSQILRQFVPRFTARCENDAITCKTQVKAAVKPPYYRY